MQVKIERQGDIDILVIAIPIEPKASSTGASTVIAGTGGFQPTMALYNGKQVKLNLNAIVKK